MRRDACVGLRARGCATSVSATPITRLRGSAWASRHSDLFHAQTSAPPSFGTDAGLFVSRPAFDALGWDDVWLSEHHFIADGYTPSMLALAAAIAARTSRIEIGTSVLLLPLHDPLRVAEDAATVDVASGGRLQLGLAVGYRKGEFTGFGIPAKERAARMDEALPILRRLFAGERVTTTGKFYRYSDVELTPLPVQRAPKLWIGGFSEPAVRRAARLGDAYISTGPIAPLQIHSHNNRVSSEAWLATAI